MNNKIYSDLSAFTNPSSLWAALIIDQLVKNGVKNFYCAPGMRNAPLLKAISLHPEANFATGFDERAQSYRALGFIRASKKPAALVCTSGTAVANFLPAIIEAQKSRIPLIVLSADRPGELNAIDANQTIDQTEVLRDYCKNYWMTSEPQRDYPPRALSGRIAHLIHSTLSGPQGPLHINIPFREPLDHTAVEMDPIWAAAIHEILSLATPSLEHAPLEKRIAQSELTELFNDLDNAQRPLVVFGPLDKHGPEVLEDMEFFLEHYQGSFSCDVTTGLKYRFGSEQGLIPTFDHPEVLSELEKSNPDLIIHFGHRLTSKHYYKFLEKRLSKDPMAKIIQICESHQHEDPGLAFQKRWSLNPSTALKAINAYIKDTQGRMENTKKEPLLNFEAMIASKSQIIESSPLNYPVMTKKAVELLEGVRNIFMGNSTFIRSFDSYASQKPQGKSWQVVANRGASGIEGHIAMTQGIYEANKEITVAFMGDVSFIHDLNSLASLSTLDPKAPVLIVLANNHGGGIFKLLPVGKKENEKQNPFLPMLTTPHHIDLAPIIQGFGIKAQLVKTKEEYETYLKQWSDAPELLILECVFTDEDNAQTYDQLKTVKL